jgi:transcriptional regulator with XRE-family HTH domain
MLAKNKDPLDEMIGRNIRLHRLRNRMSQSKLGKSIGVTFQQVQKYEGGVNRVSGNRLIHIARVLATPIEAFFAEPQTDLVHESILAGDRQAFRLLDAFAKIKDERLRLAVLGIAESAAYSGKNDKAQAPPHIRRGDHGAKAPHRAGPRPGGWRGG